MGSTFYITIIAALLCFISISSVCLFSVCKCQTFESLQKAVFMPFTAIIGVIVSGFYFWLYKNGNQFLTSLSLIELITPFAVILAVFPLLSVIKKPHSFPLLILSACIIGTMVVPDDAMLAVAPFNIWCNRLIIILVWFGFSLIYRYANSGEATLAIQSTTIACGIAVLGIISAIPALLGIFGVIYLAGFTALFAFTKTPTRIQISEPTACCFGFVMFIPMLWTITENAGSCIAIYSLYLIVDFVWAVGLRLTFNPQYRDLLQNTAYNCSLREGITPTYAIAFTARGQILLLFLGSFQALANQHSSLLMVSILITAWVEYQQRTLSEPAPSIKEINRQVLDDLQDKINDIRDHINRSDGL